MSLPEEGEAIAVVGVTGLRRTGICPNRTLLN